MSNNILHVIPVLTATRVVVGCGAAAAAAYRDMYRNHIAFQGRCRFVLIDRDAERYVLFNDALNTFNLRLYGVRHMVKDHSDSEKGNPLAPHRLLLSINSKGSFICTVPHTG